MMLEDVAIPARAAVSVLVLTRNEEANIAECLESLRWAAEVLVVDSMSTDRTVEIAEALGAKVCPHAFAGYADQRNWALQNLPFAHDWLLMIDADERIPGALADEIREVLSRSSDAYSGFYISRRLFFMGRWLRHGGLYPTWLLRLFKRRVARVEERPVNEHVIVNGRVGYLTQPFDHLDRRPLGDWVVKHNRYSDLGADEYLRERSHEVFRTSIQASLRGDQAERKRWMKLRIWDRLPLLLRPFLFFAGNYFGKGGFLDGRAGFIYHVLWSFWARFLTDVKIVERQLARGEPQSNGRKGGQPEGRARSKEVMAS